MNEPDRNVAGMLVTAVERYPDSIAIIDESRSYTYRELASAIADRVSRLEELRVVAGDRVVIPASNAVPAIATYYATLLVGGTACLISRTFPERVQAVAINRVQPRAVVDPLGDPAGSRSTADPVAVLGERLVRSDMHDHDPAQIVLTSGTSGQQKGVVLSHGNVRFCVESKVRYLSIRRTDTLLLFLPIHHCFGLNAVLGPGLAAGATVSLVDGFEPRSTWARIARDGVTMLFGVPTTYRSLLLALRSSTAVPTSLRYCFSAAAPLATGLQREWFDATKLHMFQGYGLTETSPFATYNGHPAEAPGSVGQAIQGVSVRIRPVPGVEEPLGEVQVRGPNVMLGYWVNGSINSEMIVDGWLSTGDVGWVDEGGFLCLGGRTDDMIIVNGKNVRPAEIERSLSDVAPGVEAVVYGVESRITGEAVCAAVAKSGRQLSVAYLHSRLREVLEPFKVPTQWRRVESIPTSRTGKVLRRELAANHEGLERLDDAYGADR